MMSASWFEPSMSVNIRPLFFTDIGPDLPRFFNDGQDGVLPLVLEESGDVGVADRLNRLEAGGHRGHGAQALQPLRDGRQVDACGK